MDKEKEMIVFEAFIRRASQLNLPFMLKGSYVTRQYFSNPSDRLTNDLDWVYMEKLADVDYTKKVLDDWAIKVTETQITDEVKFRSFTENAFWRMIDYAMSEDFPTVNTDILSYYADEIFEFPLDVSFNLDLPLPPIPLNYQPMQGESFIIPYTAPLPLQISWKLHQTLVRPRFKDIFDLIHLLKHPTFDAEMREQAINALVAECFADKINPKRLGLIIEANLREIFKPFSINREWLFWRTGENLGSHSSYESAKFVTNPENLPNDLEAFQTELRNSFEQAGFTSEMANNLPLPTNYVEKKPQLISSISGFSLMNDEELKEVMPLLSEYEEPKEKPSFFDALRNLFK